jgi:hypothetical protein
MHPVSFVNVNHSTDITNISMIEKVPTWRSKVTSMMRYGVATAGFVAAAIVVRALVLRVMENYSKKSEDTLYLVCHDNKPDFEQKLGRPLPRLGVVDIETGKYSQVLLNNSTLAKAKDLESLKWVKKNEYLTCESKGNCFHFSINKDQTGEYSATVHKEFKLPVPTHKFYNIEGIALKGAENSEICWSHRGGIFAGEEPWTRCASFDLEKGEVGKFTEQQVDDPFGVPNRLNRAISDQAIGEKTGKDYFIATIDTEGSEGIAATEDAAYSFLYTKDECLKIFPGDKVEALHINAEETSAVIATDNEAAGSKVCTVSLIQGDSKCVDVRAGEEYGVGGIAPLKL